MAIKTNRNPADRLPVGGKIASANTNVNQFSAAGGTNTGTRTLTTFELTAINTSSAVSFNNWILEITQAGYEQKKRIVSTTQANPGVVTLEKPFYPALPASGNVTFIVYPILVQPLVVTPDIGMTGTLTLLRGNGNVALNLIALLRAGDPAVLIFVENPSSLYYVFSTNAGTETFYWREGA